MKRLLFPLLAALALPTAVNADSNEMERQDKERDYYLKELEITAPQKYEVYIND